MTMTLGKTTLMVDTGPLRKLTVRIKRYSQEPRNVLTIWLGLESFKLMLESTLTQTEVRICSVLISLHGSSKRFKVLSINDRTLLC